MVRHSWTESDDVAALYLYMYGDGRTSAIETVAHARGMTAASMRMRVGNFKALASGSGLQNWARQSETVFEKYGQSSEPELKKLAGL